MSRKIDKDKWIKLALQRGYLVALPNGDIYRAVKADYDGYVDRDKGRTLVKVQTHKATERVYFNMTYCGITKSVLVNRVVAWRFYPNPDNLPQVNHIDGNKANNAKDNLEWSSSSDNEKHAHATGLKTGRGSSNSNAKLTVQDVLVIRSSEKKPVELATDYDVSRSTIVNIISRRTWVHV